MSTWITENKPIALIIGIGTAAFLGLSTVGVMKLMEESALQAEFTTAKSDVDAAARAAQTPTKKVLDTRKKDIAQFETRLSEAKQEFVKYTPTAEQIAELDPEQFRVKLQNTVKTFKEKAKTQGIRVLDGFFMGFEPYSTAPALKQATGMLQYQLGAIDWLMNTAIDCHVTDVRRVFRERTILETNEIPAKDAKKGTKVKTETKAYEVMTCSVTLKGKRQSIGKLINSIITNDKYLFLIKAMRSKNEKTAALSIVNKTAVKGTPAPAPVTGEISFDTGIKKKKEVAKEVAAAEKILLPVLGSEEVELHLVLDLIVFPVAETEKPSTLQNEKN